MSAANHLLVVRNLETWYGPIKAMQGVNLELTQGAIVAVLGANGAGKSTLLNTIAGVVDPFKGDTVFDGERIDGLDADQVCRRGLVLVPEGRQVYPFLNVRDNLMMGAFARRDKKSVSDDFQRVLQWFPKLQERLLQHAGLLSGGEQQMVAIGRAVMSKPRLLMLDEPSLGLSPILTREIFAIVQRIRTETGTTILLVEQNASIALENADYAYVMELGRIVAAGTREQMLAKSDIQDAYLGQGVQQRWKQRRTWR
jgi:branched-chain amino acid transport system ATP-binding protein